MLQAEVSLDTDSMLFPPPEAAFSSLFFESAWSELVSTTGPLFTSTFPSTTRDAKGYLASLVQ